MNNAGVVSNLQCRCDFTGDADSLADFKWPLLNPIRKADPFDVFHRDNRTRFSRLAIRNRGCITACSKYTLFYRKDGRYMGMMKLRSRLSLPIKSQLGVLA